LFGGDGNIASSNESNRAENGSSRNPGGFWSWSGEREVRLLVINERAIVFV
jgi:hypothetical protein